MALQSGGAPRPARIRVTPVADYLHRLIADAQERRWGRVRRPAIKPSLRLG